MKIYANLEFITGFSVGCELIDDEEIGYLLIDIGIIRINFNWDR